MTPQSLKQNHFDRVWLVRRRFSSNFTNVARLWNATPPTRALTRPEVQQHMTLSALLKAHFPTWTAPTPVEGMSPAAACQKEVLAALRGVSTWAGCHTAGFQCGTITGKRQQVDAYTAHASNLAARTGSTSGPVVCETGLFRGGSATVWLCSSPHARLIAFDLVVDPNVSAVLHHYFPQ